ncbi:hypothetical protein PV646_34185 [Streptomyces sp. ID05-26A]|nr:hypothetical protein [Streptomyces sp. ID05-26A]
MLSHEHPTGAPADATGDTPTPAPKSRRHSIAGRIGAHISWANTPDRAARTAPAVRAAMARFEKQVDPDGVLAPEERAKRAANARTAYFTRLALKSHAARRKGRTTAA